MPLGTAIPGPRVVIVDPRKDRTWLQATPQVDTDAGKDAVPDTVDHCVVKFFWSIPEDRTWASKPATSGYGRLCTPLESGKDAFSAVGWLPDTVDHCVVIVDPRKDRTWLQATPQVDTDAVHALDVIMRKSHGLLVFRPWSTHENWSEAVKKLKPRILQRILDTHKGKTEKGVENPYSCLVLAGARSMEDRRRALQDFKDGDIRLLICTDVAARGIDIKELPYVVNLTLPDKSEDYVHRVGRVGRADAMGLAISIVSAVPEKVWFCKQKGYKPWLNPKPEDIKLVKAGGHTIMMKEMDLLKAVEARLGGKPVARLKDDFALPPQIEARLAGTGDKYGQQKGVSTKQEFPKHFETIQQNVESLAVLEWQAQTNFLTLKHKFVVKKV
eukprot:gene8157-1411_t